MFFFLFIFAQLKISYINPKIRNYHQILIPQELQLSRKYTNSSSGK